ncbi:MAG: ATP-binding protein [Coriobacteriia bacterium]|nr:ATP-binding protein [Coriobacteriia bacterium]
MALPRAQQDMLSQEGALHTLTVATNLDYSQETNHQTQDEEHISLIAIYEDMAFAPRIIEIPFTDARETIGALAATTHTQVSNLGGSFPYRIISEACENLIHADFAGVVISISDRGNTLVISDQGPGIAHSSYALNTGFTSATPEMKSIIRGVGAGFTIIKEYLDSVGGTLRLDSNIGGGTVVTLRLQQSSQQPSDSEDKTPPGRLSHSSTPSQQSPYVAPIPSFTLNTRQKDVLGVLLKYEFVGPQLVSQTLGVGLATAHRDLKVLEEHGLVQRNERKKSTLTDAGFEYVDYLSSL